MNLSMWILLDELYEFSPKSAIQEGQMTIKGVQLFPDGGHTAADYVYIGNTREFFGSHKSIILVHRNDLLIIEEANFSDVFNQVLQIFDKYRDWNERMNLARTSHNCYQDILDIAHEVFRCPMLFGNTNLHIYALTKQYPKELVYDEWDELKTFYTIPLSLIERVRSLDDAPKMLPDYIDPAVMGTWKGMKFNYQIRSNCFLNGQIWGHFYLYYNKEVVSKGILQLAKHVAKLYSQLLQENNENCWEKYSQYSWVYDILEGKQIQRETLRTICYSMKWDESDMLLLYKVAHSATVTDLTFYHWLCDSISERCKSAIVFPYENSIVIIMREQDRQMPAALEYITRLINTGSYKCGISFAFSGLMNIPAHYTQAGIAIELAPDLGNRVHKYNDCMLSGLTRKLKTLLKWQDWITPSLYKLIQMDEENNTEYYVTLYCLLMNKWHLGNTARALYIHRNTLLYRLEKIKNIIDFDINDESTCAYLRLCYDLLMSDYPINIPVSKEPALTEGE